MISVTGIATQAAAGMNAKGNTNKDEISFGQALSQALGKVNDSQIKADNMITNFLVGDVKDIHQVTIAMGEAKLMLQLAVEVRNKVVEAYQELSRMQV